MGNAFDLRTMFNAIDALRTSSDLSWAALSRDVGVAASTIRRFGEADDAEADGVLALVRWLGASPEDFVTNASAEGQTLRPTGDGYVRVDMDLVAKAAGDVRGARGRTRTTIQHLTVVASQAGVSIASLTRVADG